MLNKASVRSIDPRVEFGGTPILLPFCSLARGEEELRLRPREGSTDGLALIPVSRSHTDRERRPSGRLQHLGDGGRRRIDPTAHVGKARVEVRHGAHTDGVVVAAGQQARPRGRTESGRVEVAVSQAASCEPIEVRGVDGGSEATEVGKSCVVEERYENVGRRRGWNIGLRPPWRGIGDQSCQPP